MRRVWLCTDARDPRAFVERILGPVAPLPDGRPCIASGRAVSISHGRGVVAVAVADAGLLGVDVERVRPLPALALAERWFADGDAAWVAEQPEGVRATAFLWLWTQREAIGKARGLGLRRG